MPRCSCGGQRTTCGGSLFTHQVMGDQIQVGSLGGKLPFPWSHSLAPSIVLCTMFQSLLTSLPGLLYTSLAALLSTHFYYTLSTEGYRLLDQLFI